MSYPAQNAPGITPLITGTTDSYNEKANRGAQYPMGAPQQNGLNGEATQQTGAANDVYKFATPLGSLQKDPAPVDCPACGTRCMTTTNVIQGNSTHLAALLCCCVLCLGCIPYFTSWFKDSEHKCSQCGSLLAVWHRSGRTEVVIHGRT